MNTSEREPIQVSSFLEVAYQLPEDEGLFLSRNTVRRLKLNGHTQIESVHYEGIDSLSSSEYPIEGRDVTDEFRALAECVFDVVDAPPPGPAFPRIIVNNLAERDSLSQPLDIIELINDKKVAIYSGVAQNGGGEILRVSLAPIIKDSIGKVGINPEQAVVVSGKGIKALRDIGLTIEVRLTQSFTNDECEMFVLPLNPRGWSALELLQLQIAEACRASPFNVRDDPESAAEVLLHIETRPDLQTVLLQLIDSVEARGYELYCYKEADSTGEMQFVITVVDITFQAVAELARDSTLDMVLYNACRAAKQYYPEMGH